MENSTPKYMALVQWIREQIRTSRLLPGQKLYSENELKDKFGISRQTVRHAISILETEGVLRRVRGSGTYIQEGQRLVSGRNTYISVVTTYADSYIFPRTIQSIENALFQRGFSVRIALTNNQNSKEKSILKDILNRDETAGLLIEPTKSGIPNPNLNLYRKIQGRGIPMLFLNSYYPELSIPHVSMDDRRVGEQITDHLISMGHQRIGGIFKLDDGQGRLRYAGYLEAMMRAGLEVEERCAVWIDTEEAGHLADVGQRILDRVSGCTALVCYNDQVAFHLMDLMKRRGIRVPEDMSLVSVDDSELAVFGGVGLTTLPYPMEQMGEKAVEYLLRRMEEPSFEESYEFCPKLVSRASVKRISGS